MSAPFINSHYSISTAENQDKRQKIINAIAERQKIKYLLYDNIKDHLTDNQREYYKNCANFLKLNEKGNITAGRLCRNRYCPICNLLKSRGKYAKIINAIEQFPKCEFIFITLTVKNVEGENLKQELEHISKSFHKFQNRSPMNKVSLGYFRTTEITYNSIEKTFHPHIHMLVAVKPNYFKSKDYKTTYEWRISWEKSAQLDYTSQVNIKKVEGGENIFKAVAEVSKYCTKLSTIIFKSEENSAIEHLIKATKNRRLIATGGIFKKLNKIDDEIEMDTDSENSKYYMYKNGEYIQFDDFML